MLLGSYGASQVNVGLSVYLKDNFTVPALQVKNSFKGLRDEFTMYTNNLRAAQGLYTGLATAGAVGVAGMASWFKTGAKYDYLIRGVAGAAGELNASGEKFKALYDMGNKIGQSSIFKPSEVAISMRELGLAGLGVEGILATIQPVAGMAAASLTDIGTATNYAINTMYQFNYRSQDMLKIVDLLTYASNKSNVNVVDLGESLKYVSATAVDMGQTLPEVLSALMVLGNAGLKGTVAGVGLENMYRYMAIGMGKFGKEKKAKLWASWGIDPKDLTDAVGNMKPLYAIFEAMGKSAIRGNTNVQNALIEIFQVRGKRPASKLLQMIKGEGADGDTWKKFMADLQYIEKNPGFANKVANFQMGGPEGALARMAGTWEVFKNQFTVAIAPLVVPLLKILTALLKVINFIIDTKFGRFLTAMVAGFVLVGTAVYAVKAALATIYLAQASLKGSFEGMKTSMLVGWQQLKSAATGYFTTLRSGTAATSMNAATAGSLGILGYTAGKRGNGTYWAKGPNGRFVNPNMVVNQTPATPGILGSLRGGAGRIGMSGAAMSGLSGLFMGMGEDQGPSWSGGLMSVGSGALTGAMSGGPWGALIGGALSGGIYLLTSMLGQSSDATDANTGALGENTATSRRLSGDIRYTIAQFADRLTNKTYEVVQRYGLKAPENKNSNVDFAMADRTQNYLNNPWKGSFFDLKDKNVMNLYIDGNFKKKIEYGVNDALNKLVTIE